jgi:hypothetical protein
MLRLLFRPFDLKTSRPSYFSLDLISISIFYEIKKKILREKVNDLTGYCGTSGSGSSL